MRAAAGRVLPRQDELIRHAATCVGRRRTMDQEGHERVPSHDETSPVAPHGGSVRRPPVSRTRSTGGGGGARRPAPAATRGRTTATRQPGRPARPASGGGRGTGGGGRPPGGGGGGRGPGGGGTGDRRPGGKAARSKQQRRRRRLKIAGGVLFGMFVLVCVFIGVVYASTEVPSPDSFQNKQTTIVYYQDGTTEMARLGEEDRTNVKLSDVSEGARNAVLAAENRNFYSDPGISFTGIVRATWNNLTGGSTQGGSTITQQYVKNAYLTADQTLSRKFQELFLSIKLDNNFSKDEILENYLNTIYFGRGAYGIEAAADTYFGVHASELTPEQGAVLAVLIRSPSNYDPAENPEGAKDRWGLVLDGMVEEGWLDAAERQAATYPEVRERAGSDLGIPSGPQGLIVQRALAELRGMGYSDQQLEAGGLKITTTVDPRMQKTAHEAVAEVMDGEDNEVLREALVAIDPKTGAVRAYYGGKSGVGTDYARAYRQPGSSMKPYVLATALEQGIGVNSRRDGSSPQTFDDREAPVRNSGGVSCPYCTLREAMTQSLNTTYYGLAYEVGPQAVAQTARKVAGLPETWQGGFLDGKTTLAGGSGTTGSAIGIGEYEMRPIDQAHGFATFAAGGKERDPFFVRTVVDSSGKVLLERDTAGEAQQAVSEEVANDVTYALTDVADYSRRSLDDGRDVAAKTGTQGLDDENNSDAWIVGYTPSLVTSVWMGTDERDPIINADGGIIYGSGLPGEIWQTFMNRVLEGTPQEDLPDSALIEGDDGENGVSLPEPEPEPEPEPTQQSQAPAPTTSEAPASTPSEEVVQTTPSETVEPTVEEEVPTGTSQPTGSTTTSPTASVAGGTRTAGGGGAAGTRSQTQTGNG
jgi:membrane peptidoglycan carboxypeptidase